MQTIKYGSFESQEADIYLSESLCLPVVCLLHGGFWRMPYGREEMTSIAQDLVRRGFAVWNLEYRRVGASGGGWPGTLEDVVAGINYLTVLAAEGLNLDLTRVTLIGHSAGGHLALLAAANGNKSKNTVNSIRLKPIAAVGLAPVVDLERTFAFGSGKNAVDEFMGGTPQQYPGRYFAASPIAQVPLGVQQLIMHGSKDEVLPIELSRNYSKTAITAGDMVDFIELPGASHMDFLDPESMAHSALCRWLSVHSQSKGGMEK
ncbi:MAG: alpha/beta hydrolase [Bacteriovoracaceae bacterium]|nr:alpha/beta hydrolase [Bacteroidota bacterium]